MKKVKIIATETTKNDELIKPLIGTVWTDFKKTDDHIIINCCGGIKLSNDEFEFV